MVQPLSLKPNILVKVIRYKENGCFELNFLFSLFSWWRRLINSEMAKRKVGSHRGEEEKQKTEIIHTMVADLN